MSGFSIREYVVSGLSRTSTSSISVAQGFNAAASLAEVRFVGVCQGPSDFYCTTTPKIAETTIIQTGLTSVRIGDAIPTMMIPAWINVGLA